MGRLDDIVQRNRYPKRTERVTVGIGISLFILLIIFLMAFTNLGRPNFDENAPSNAPPTKIEKRVNDVKLR